jgi:hypothetical protein
MNDHTRRALHRAVDRIIVAWPHAQTDSRARGYISSNYEQPGNTGSASVETAALQRSHADEWLGELRAIWTELTHIGELPEMYGANDTTRGLTAMLFHKRVDQLTHEPTITRIIVLGNKAAAWWPTTPTKGDTIAGVTIGARTNSIEECGLCGKPVIGGHHDPIRRIDGQAFHRTPCWYAAAMSRGRHPRQQQAS